MNHKFEFFTDEIEREESEESEVDLGGIDGFDSIGRRSSDGNDRS